MLAKIPLGGNIVTEKRIGNTHICFCDAAYAENNTPENSRLVLEEAARASRNIMLHNQGTRPER